MSPSPSEMREKKTDGLRAHGRFAASHMVCVFIGGVGFDTLPQEAVHACLPKQQRDIAYIA